MESHATHTLVKNVRSLMESEGLSQQRLAKRSGVSQAAIGYLLRYKDEQDRHPTTQTVEALARAFGLQAWQLMMPSSISTGPSRQVAEAGAHYAQKDPSAMNELLFVKAVGGAVDILHSRRILASPGAVAQLALALYKNADAGKGRRSAATIADDVLRQIAAEEAKAHKE
jgi:transcriptional regulator with XRE-family HTH domain